MGHEDLFEKKEIQCFVYFILLIVTLLGFYFFRGGGEGRGVS